MVGYGLIGGETVAFTVVMLLDFPRDPFTPLAYFLLPAIWIGGEWREVLAIGLGLLAILVVAALLIALAGNNIAGRVAFAALFVSGFAFAVGWILSARSRMRRIIKMREDGPKLDS